MRTLFQDYESFFGQVVEPDGTKLNLSLANKDLSYTDYVRHPQFALFGVSLRWEDEERARFYRWHEIPAVYAQIDWKNTRVVAHNAIFEGLVNYECFGVVPAEYFCTLAAAEAIYQGAVSVGLDNLAKLLGVGEKLPDLVSFRGLRPEDLTEEQWETLARYANNDVDLTVPIYEMFSAALPENERVLMSRTIMLFADPVLEVDVPLAQEALQEAIEERDKLVAKTGLTLEQISGNITFRNALQGKLGWIPQKQNDKGELIPAFAKTDLEFVKLKSHPDEAVRDLVNARLEVKSNLGITRAERLIKIGTTGTKKLPVCLHYSRAHTMRWSGGNKVNLQNLTRGSKLRRSIKAPPGHVLVVVDSSQIECRSLAWVAGEEELLEIFRTGGDPYCTMGTKIYGFEIIKSEHPDERFMGKTALLGLGYGMGAPKFYNEIVTGARGKAMPITLDFAYRVVNIYRSSNPNIVRFWSTAEQMLEYLAFGDKPREWLDGLVTLDPVTKRVIFPNGTWLRYAGLTCDEGDYVYQVELKGKPVAKKIYGGLFTENFIQKLARDVVAAQILKVSERYRPVLFVHDEGVFCVREEEAEEALAYAKEVFKENLPYTDIPLGSEGGFDVCYSK